MISANTAAINNLIMVAQTTSNEDVRNKALSELWDICGNRIAGIMAGKSYQMDSDFCLKGCSPNTESGPETTRMMEILNGISHEDNFESDCYWKDATQLIRKTLNRSPKLSEYFEVFHRNKYGNIRILS